MTAALALAAALVLLGSGATQMARPDHLRRALAAHALLPGGAQRLVRLTLPLAEVAIGLAVCLVSLGWLRGHPPLVGRLVALVTAALFLTYAVYTFLAWQRAGDSAFVPCGCGVGGVALTGWQPARSVLLASGAVSAALADGGPAPRTAGEQGVVLIAALAFTLLVGILPASRVRTVVSGQARKGWPA